MKAIHLPDCKHSISAYDYKLVVYANASEHIYRFCRICETRAQSPIKQSEVPKPVLRALTNREKRQKADKKAG